MATLRFVLAAVSVMLLAGEALGECSGAGWGVHNTASFVMETVIVDLSSTDGDILVDIPFKGIPGCQAVGVETQFCESGNVSFTSDYSVRVQRDETSSSTKGYLFSLVYCDSYGAPTTPEPTSDN